MVFPDEDELGVLALDVGQMPLGEGDFGGASAGEAVLVAGARVAQGDAGEAARDGVADRADPQHGGCQEIAQRAGRGRAEGDGPHHGAALAQHAASDGVPLLVVRVEECRIDTRAAPRSTTCRAMSPGFEPARHPSRSARCAAIQPKALVGALRSREQ
ncbi:hypothetical protein [Streptomyces sp. NBC_01092]|uniref:hypothetical protein n=1 Tax=Streptomyces sp. NBC_01092 TaxID=2903748 RepID=UPI00386C553B|nr:hypothetical protein OG254_38200 [Streptomyces sp. NBC_01092]